MHKKSLMLYLLILLLSIELFPQQFKKDFENYLTQYYNNKNVPSISAGVLAEGKISWLGSRGYADIENFIPASPNTVYRIASISKPLTAVAVMQLVEKGKINLDEDVHKYVPYFPVKRWKFTVRQLLNHTAGIRNYRPGEFDSKIYYPRIRDAVKAIASDSLEFQPGTRYQYTTLGYNLLGAVIEKVSGLSYDEYIKRNIFIPAQMNSTYIENQPEIIFNRARGYVKNEERRLQNAPLADLSVKYPGGGIISSAEDLLKFTKSLLEGMLISPASLDSMIVPLKLNNGRSQNYGLGFMIDVDDKGRRFFGHSGGGTGFLSYLKIYPDENAAAVYVINCRDRNLDNPADELLKILFDNEFKIPLKSLADEFISLRNQYGIDSVISIYNSMNTEDYKEYDFSLDEVITFGNDLINSKNILDAIKFFRFLSVKYSDNQKVYLGLADAYYNDGNKGLALKNYRAALKNGAPNKYASDMIKKLSGS
jgi:serine beta-lactamase-like protein LACTB, mitochondrial